MRAAAILKLAPKETESAIIARPELCSYQQRLAALLLLQPQGQFRRGRRLTGAL